MDSLRQQGTTLMKTVVYQTFRTVNVPGWVQRCLHSVRDWAAAQGFDYRFIDDRMFDYVPPWYLQRAAGNMCFITNLARLTLAREFLNGGYDRTIWVDADIIVFAPDLFRPFIEKDYAFCHEVWVDRGAQAELLVVHRVNNSVTVMVKGTPFLDFYIEAAQTIAGKRAKLSNLDIGGTFITKLRQILPFHLLPGVGLLSPLMMADVVNGTDEYLRIYMAQQVAKFGAANLCGSFRNQMRSGVVFTDRLYEAVIDRCVQTRGEVLNRWFQTPDPLLVQRVLEGKE